MIVYQVIFNFILYISEGLMIYYYANTFFKKKYSTVISLLGVLGSHMVLMVIYYSNNALLNFISLLIVYCLTFTILYNAHFLSAFFNSILLLTMMIASEWVVLFLTSLFVEKGFDSYQESMILQFFDVALSKLIYYFTCIVLCKIFSKKKRADEKRSVFLYLMIMPVSSVIALFVFRYVSYEVQLSNRANIFFTSVSILLLVSNIIIFYIYEYSLSNAAELYELKAMEQKQEIDKTYFDILEQNNKDLKIFTHDIKNHLEQISNLSDNEDINRYVTVLYGTINRYSNVALSGNKTLDVIINKYKSLCENKKIKIVFNVKTSNLSNIQDMDLANILNNILDNAVEAVDKSRDKNIVVDIFSKTTFDVIKMQNSCDDPPRTLDRKLITSKKDKRLHGLGIDSVQRTLKKYDGLFDWSYNEKSRIFETTIAIPKNS